MTEQKKELEVAVSKQAPIWDKETSSYYVVPEGATLIGIGGKLASGKDTVADFLVEYHGFRKIGMSDTLADMLEVLNPLVPATKKDGGIVWLFRKLGLISPAVEEYADLLDRVGYTKAKENPEVRRLLQQLGTEVGRNMIHTDLWVNLMARKVAEIRAAGDPVIVTGIRFPNELDKIRELGGHLWWVAREQWTANDQAMAVDLRRHSSEGSVEPSDFDTIIRNTTTLSALYARVQGELYGLEDQF